MVDVRVRGLVVVGVSWSSVLSDASVLVAFSYVNVRTVVCRSGTLELRASPIKRRRRTGAKSNFSFPSRGKSSRRVELILPPTEEVLSLNVLRSRGTSCGLRSRSVM